MAGGRPAPSTSATTASKADNASKTITFWVVGGDTPKELRTYLQDTFKAKTGATLKIEEQGWGDIVTKLTTSLPDAKNTPDVTELGNTQAPTFTNVGAFSDVSDLYEELGGAKLLQSFVDVGSVDGKKFALPYYFGSRYMFARSDVWKEAGVNTPTTLEEFNTAVKTITTKNPRKIKDFSGFFLGGQDWRNGISWVFANGGELAKKENGQWVSTLSDPNTIKGLTQLQDLFKNASKAPADAKDATPWLYVNDSDEILDENQKVTGKTSLAAATIMAPGWAHWSIGDLVEKDGKKVREWNDAKFAAFVLPGNDGKPAPVFAGGSNIGISKAEPEPGALARPAADHLLAGVPADARQGGSRPGQRRLRQLARHRPVRQGAHRLGVQLQADPGRPGLGSRRVEDDPRGVLRQDPRRLRPRGARGRVRRQDHADPQPQVTGRPCGDSH